MHDRGQALRELPSVDALLKTAEAERLLEELSPAFVSTCARALVERWRTEVLAGKLDAGGVRARRAAAGVELARDAAAALAPSLIHVVNATGVVVHTNLGRAPWPARVAARALAVARSYTNLEYDVERGARGLREAHLVGAQRLFGAEAALVVNNNAAAVFLVLNTLAAGKETIVSRGELVEIGGSFRIPDILAKSGSTLREVGTTNRTRLGDYAAAINERTGLLMKVHPSNYRVLGFTEEVGVRDLAALGKERGIPVVEDLGSGDVVDLARAGVHGETTVGASLAAGVDLVTISGDKLLGGPQAGIVLGSAALVARLKANPLYRALRPDKVTIAALEELFAIYQARDPWREVPVLALLVADRATLDRRAQRLAERLRGLAGGLHAAVVEGASTVGGGAAPLAAIPTPLVAVTHPRRGATEIEAALRRHRPPVVARVEDDRVLVDLRTVAEDEEDAVVDAFAAAGAA